MKIKFKGVSEKGLLFYMNKDLITITYKSFIFLYTEDETWTDRFIHMKFKTKTYSLTIESIQHCLDEIKKEVPELFL